jgi:hypothetical protein
MLWGKIEIIGENLKTFKWCVIMLNQGDDLLDHTTFNLEC